VKIGTNEPWMGDGLCAQTDPELFFPPKGGNEGSLAKQVCHGCPVIAACLAYALDHPSLDGIWGGRSFRERQELRALRRAGVAA
jgi:WhiB family transcriptional regulator, redox-sensing transcriptional regulator